ncbi:delta-class carbonic anhydrase [Roseibium algae]|uniref:Delta-class carbonic anhydrase n=1 Tax=Roseibium algae TaxID=3123038 RepID=A0ABU8TJ54_9HYPH
MMNKFSGRAFAAASLLLVSTAAYASSDDHGAVSDEVIAGQRSELAHNTEGKGFGPQAPRDIETLVGTNTRVFEASPSADHMNLCNIHFHENAEHKGGEFNKFAGNGDGHGYGTGYEYSGKLTEAELAPIDMKIGASEHGDLVPGDTIEVHYVYSSAKVNPGPTLGACLSDSIANPQLRVEAQVFVLVNDDNALDFVELAKVGKVDGLNQALNVPSDTGTPVTYAGSTTGPGYNEKGSPFQVTWNVRPNVEKVNIKTVGTWLKDNIFDEDHAHGVRNLVTNPALLSEIAN